MIGNKHHGKMGEILTEAITVLCKASLDYRAELHVEGLIGITLDNEEIILVNVNKVIQNDPPITDPASTGAERPVLRRRRTSQEDGPPDVPRKRAKSEIDVNSDDNIKDNKCRGNPGEECETNDEKPDCTELITATHQQIPVIDTGQLSRPVQHHTSDPISAKQPRQSSRHEDDLLYTSGDEDDKNLVVPVSLADNAGSVNTGHSPSSPLDSPVSWTFLPLMETTKQDEESLNGKAASFSVTESFHKKSLKCSVGSCKARKLGNTAMTPQRRCEEFPGNSLRADGETQLFCDACKVPLDWQRRSSIMDHCEKSRKHIKNMEAIQSQEKQSPSAKDTGQGQIEPSPGEPLDDLLSDGISLVTVTPQKRIREFPGQFLRAVGTTRLFCDACMVPLDWQRRSSVSDHCDKSKKHSKNVTAILSGAKPNPMEYG